MNKAIALFFLSMKITLLFLTQRNPTIWALHLQHVISACNFLHLQFKTHVCMKLVRGISVSCVNMCHVKVHPEYLRPTRPIPPGLEIVTMLVLPVP